MDIYTVIMRDHRTAEALFARTLSATTKTECRACFEELKYELLIHALTEDATFYEALRQHSETALDIQHAAQEHEEMARSLADLSEPKGFGGKAWLAKFLDLRGAVMHHIVKEENEIFDEARAILSDDQAERLAAAMNAMKRQQHMKMAA